MAFTVKSRTTIVVMSSAPAATPAAPVARAVPFSISVPDATARVLERAAAAGKAMPVEDFITAILIGWTQTREPVRKTIASRGMP